MLRALAKPLGLQISKSATAVAARFAGVPERQLLHKHDSLFNCANADFLDAEFDKWVEDPASVESSMSEFFEKATASGFEVPLQEETLRPLSEGSSSGGGPPRSILHAMRVGWMLRLWAVRGHRLADLDPLCMVEKEERRPGSAKVSDKPMFHPSDFGFTEADLDQTFHLAVSDKVGGFLALDQPPTTLRDLYAKLQVVYGNKIGWEYMHISDSERLLWLRKRIETPDVKRLTISHGDVLHHLAKAELFEKFLQIKFANVKRFGLDGSEVLIPGMIEMLEKSSDLGVESVVMGMAHRGRLNVLANVCGKKFGAIFGEFQGGNQDELEFGSGDVKYHLGTVQDRVLRNGKPVRVSLVANPSHLEAVNPVVAGKVRAKQRYAKDHDGSKSIPILLHGDAAFSGQGICYETMGLSHLYRYQCGGTIHIVVNNQIGFTTNPQENRSSPYCTDIGKQGTPVFHVNGDDVESVVRVCKLAIEYRQRWKSDVIIDLICYRRNGHNEKDEPMFTQPTMYQAIKNHPSVLTVYEQKLIKEGAITKAEAQAVRKEADATLKEEYKHAKSYQPKKEDWMESKWEHYKSSSQLASLRRTGVAPEQLTEIGKKLYQLPENFTPHPKLKSILKRGEANLLSGKNIEWGQAEALAFATLLLEGNHVRLSGQDVERGTFSHRHSVIHDYNNNNKYCPLGHLHPSQAHFEVCNSSLSEYGVTGFEIGYSMENPASLVLWEAQFGDFANGAQVMWDQFLSCGEEKWVRQCGMVVLLPHGYDGQGPEHSSARLERFLIASDEDETGPKRGATNSEEQILNSNWQVVYPSTPAQYFHVLRRQLHRSFRKPLVVFVSKAYLRAPNVSPLEDFSPESNFQLVIDDEAEDLISPPILVKRVALCSGQMYFRAQEERKARGRWDVALVRVEQLAPFPFQQVKDTLERYSNADIVWLQEEPKNMGAWSHVRPRAKTVLGELQFSQKIRYIGRNPSASPATGLASIHAKEHQQIMDQLFEE
eukprot:Rhum_TRINITY_DN14511_c4_g2::Rhum_TRINITY_DN14511_c4_g2_i1::g.93740::m.93740/K00164/OGDH, sucA; 2-oxoglutarate dehydrogenase E1 component